MFLAMSIFFLMLLRPPSSTRPYTLFPYVTLVRAVRGVRRGRRLRGAPAPRSRGSATLRPVLRRNPRYPPVPPAEHRRLPPARRSLRRPAAAQASRRHPALPGTSSIVRQKIGIASCRERECQDM